MKKILWTMPIFILFSVVLGVVIVASMMVAVMSALVGGDDQLTQSQVSEPGTAQVSEEVERYRSLFEKYAEEHGIPEYVELLMAKTMQESGGRLRDVMQSSESLGLPRNTITDPEESIDVGVEYFARVLETANGDVELALQSYNMGHGFIDYVNENNNGEYSQEMAYQFGEEQAERLGWSNYGDENYVDNVMRYLEGFESNPIEFDGSEGEWAMPLEVINITSEFGMRMHPIHNEERMHNGLDFGCSPSDAIYSVQDGLVVQSVNSNVGLGNHITVQHNDDEFSTYAHLSSLSVERGDEVSQGERLGMCGSTGQSTGPHLHLEYRTSPTGGDRRDPADLLGL